MKAHVLFIAGTVMIMVGFLLSQMTNADLRRQIAEKDFAIKTCNEIVGKRSHE